MNAFNNRFPFPSAGRFCVAYGAEYCARWWQFKHFL